jgi:hypothetical protein
MIALIRASIFGSTGTGFLTTGQSAGFAVCESAALDAKSTVKSEATQILRIAPLLIFMIALPSSIEPDNRSRRVEEGLL